MINRLFHTLAGAGLLALAAPHAIAADDAWTMDIAAAKTTAAKGGKDLLLAFTDFDWCPLSQRLNNEVLSQNAFLTAASGPFVLVKLDFPIRDFPVPESTAKIYQQNDVLALQYRIEWFPTIILADADGRPYARTGFRPGGPEAYAAHLESLRENRVRRDAGFASAAKAEGLEKAKQLAGAIDAVGLDFGIIHHFYGDIVGEINANDPGDETGFARRAAVQARLDAIHAKINALAARGNFAGIHPLIDELLETQGLTLEQKQNITFHRAKVFQMLGQTDKAAKAADEAAKIAPDSEMIPILGNFKNELVTRAKPSPDHKGGLRRKPQWRPLPQQQGP